MVEDLLVYLHPIRPLVQNASWDESGEVQEQQGNDRGGIRSGSMIAHDRLVQQNERMHKQDCKQAGFLRGPGT